jgi:hypothetical protein
LVKVALSTLTSLLPSVAIPLVATIPAAIRPLARMAQTNRVTPIFFLFNYQAS